MRAIRAPEPEQQNAVDTVLAEFFTLCPDGWHQKKCDEQLQSSLGRTASSYKANDVRWHKNKHLIDPNGLHTDLVNKNNYLAYPDGVQAESGWTPNQNKEKGSSSTSSGSSKITSNSEIGERRRFTPPTLAQVQSYVSEKRLNVNAGKFVDHYTANGWKVGRNSMKDWQAACRTWNAMDKPALSPTEMLIRSAK
jgi:uncharacterized protein YdaU (DUF1376 family)